MKDYQRNYEVPQTPPTLQPIYVTNGSGAIVVIAITLFSVVVMFVTSRNGDSAGSGIWGTVIFFSLALPVGVMAANGTIAAMYHDHQEQKTIRLLNGTEAPYAPQPPLQVVEPLQIAYEPPASPQPAQAPSFVPPVAPAESNVRFMSAAFVNELFDLQTGEFHPRRVTPNAKQVQRKPPNKEVETYLADLGIIQRGKGGQWYWNVARYPTRMEAINTIRRGHPGSLVGRGEGREGRVAQ